MKFSKLKHDKGVAGLTILLSLVTMLFVIGLLVMIFSLMGGELESASDTTTTGTASNETFATTIIDSSSPVILAQAIHNDPVCTLLYVWNATALNEYSIANYSSSACVVSFIGTENDDALGLNNTANLNITYSYSVGVNSTASGVAYDVKSSLANTTDWFDIFIVIGAMVVLILLVVIIITAIRGSGLMGAGGSNQGGSNVGSA